MSSKEGKSSAVELKQMIVTYERGVNKTRPTTKPEDNPNGMLITPEMGGKIVLGMPTVLIGG